MTLIQDLPVLLGTALGFPSTTAEYTGGMILSLGVLLGVGLAFSFIVGSFKGESSNMVFTATVLFVTMGALYLINWLPFAFIIIGTVIIGVLFATKAKEGLGF